MNNYVIHDCNTKKRHDRTDRERAEMATNKKMKMDDGQVAMVLSTHDMTLIGKNRQKNRRWVSFPLHLTSTPKVRATGSRSYFSYIWPKRLAHWFWTGSRKFMDGQWDWSFHLSSSRIWKCQCMDNREPQKEGHHTQEGAVRAGTGNRFTINCCRHGPWLECFLRQHPGDIHCTRKWFGRDWRKSWIVALPAEHPSHHRGGSSELWDLCISICHFTWHNNVAPSVRLSEWSFNHQDGYTWHCQGTGFGQHHHPDGTLF